MNTVYISIEKDTEVFEFYKEIWGKRGVSGIRSDTMTEAIETAVAIEKSKTQYLYFIDIVADDIDYMPQLAILDEATEAPILIVTSQVDEDEHHEALAKGAYFYASYCNDHMKNIRAVISVVESYNRAKKQRVGTNILTCGGVLVSLSQRKAFVNDIEVELTNYEFNMLVYLMRNSGSALSYEQIYNEVWKDKFNESHDEVIKGTLKRLRKKITTDKGEKCIIENVWGYGYKVPL